MVPRPDVAISAPSRAQADPVFDRSDLRRKTLRCLKQLIIVLTGIIVGQVILYGPSLAGKKVLLPLDLLAQGNHYVPRTPQTQRIVPHDFIMMDAVTSIEPDRRFAVAEFRAGRFPFWCPNRYAGSPCFRWSFSLPTLPGYFIASPVVLAYTQMLVAIVAGMGAYIFFRQVLQVSHWPAAIVAWCYPLSATFILWQGYGVPPVVCWLPWILLATDCAVRRPRGWGGPMLALVTGLMMLSGQSDVAGQILITSGMYALWCCIDHYGIGGTSARSFSALASATMAWTLGILMSAWLMLPLLAYVHTGSRIMNRAHGTEERPPIGWVSLPQLVIPEAWGSTLDGSLFIGEVNLPESAASAYVGLVATLFVAPLAWCSRRHRSINCFWLLLAFVSLSWSLNIPGMVALLRLPGMNLMSHNRFVFATAFATLSMAAVGLNYLWDGRIARRWWFPVPAIFLVGLTGWSLYRAAVPPEPVATEIAADVRDGHPADGGRIKNLADVARVQRHFVQVYLIAAALSAVGLGGWIWLAAKGLIPRRSGPLTGTLLVGELLWFGYGYNTQGDPQLYFPRLPVLEEIIHSVPGRVIGYNCLPANLAQTQGLSDIRGYDGVDPARFVQLVALSASHVATNFPYALLQWFFPEVTISDDGKLSLPPVLDMLSVRYVIFRRQPPAGLHADYAGEDYWAMVNAKALPRAFVPEHVETVSDDVQRLRKLAGATFDPRQIAYVEGLVDAPGSCRGSARIVSEVPTRVTVATDMTTPGLVVLADLWDTGWNAKVNGTPATILRVNHAVRGVMVPAGQGTLEFRYEPASLRWGIRMTCAALLIWCGWMAIVAGLECQSWCRPE